MTGLLTQWPHYAKLMRLDRPIGTLLLLWPTAWALWIASGGQPGLWLIVVFGLGVFLMRSAGCVINDYADRDIDRHVERTRERPLTAGRVSEKEALTLFVVLVILAFGLVLTLNSFTIMLSFIAAFLAASYPFMKRFTHLPQAYLGIAFAWAVPMVFAAQTGELNPGLWWIFAATVFWAIAYDTMYAMVDRDDDLKIGVKSTAILFGDYDRFWIGVFQLAFLLMLVMAGVVFSLHGIYYMALAIAAGQAIYHQWLIRDRDKKLCFKAFLDNNKLGAVIFAGIVLDYMVYPA
ncbi:MAG: 4-hydroxybenzoate octaprenyltransferase [Gammaproteobacteria bacterium]|jgi:4-hydroxybenzoate polyprenyltransferase